MNEKDIKQWDEDRNRQGDKAEVPQKAFSDEATVSQSLDYSSYLFHVFPLIEFSRPGHLGISPFEGLEETIHLSSERSLT